MELEMKKLYLIFIHTFHEDMYQLCISLSQKNKEGLHKQFYITFFIFLIFLFELVLFMFYNLFQSNLTFFFNKNY